MVTFTRDEELMLQKLARIEAFRDVPFVVSLKVAREHEMDFLKIVSSLESFLDLSKEDRKLCARACRMELTSS